MFIIVSCLFLSICPTCLCVQFTSLCPNYNSSCLECVTTEIFHKNLTFERFCSWSEGYCLTEYKKPDISKFPDRMIDFFEKYKNYTFNPCIVFSFIDRRYNRASRHFQFDIEFIGYHEDYSDNFPMEIKLYDGRNIGQSCSIQRYVNFSINVECTHVAPGFYHMIILIQRNYSEEVTLNLLMLTPIIETISGSIFFNKGEPSKTVSDFFISILLFIVIFTIIGFVGFCKMSKNEDSLKVYSSRSLRHKIIDQINKAEVEKKKPDRLSRY